MNPHIALPSRLHASDTALAARTRYVALTLLPGATTIHACHKFHLGQEALADNARENLALLPGATTIHARHKFHLGQEALADNARENLALLPGATTIHARHKFHLGQEALADNARENLDCQSTLTASCHD
jgi:hypothetical protein